MKTHDMGRAIRAALKDKQMLENITAEVQSGATSYGIAGMSILSGYTFAGVLGGLLLVVRLAYECFRLWNFIKTRKE